MVYFLLVKTLVNYHAHSIIYCVLSIATDERGSSVGPGARKPLVGEGIQSRRLLVLTLFLLFFLLFFPFISAPYSGVCFNNKNMEHGMLLISCSPEAYLYRLSVSCHHGIMRSKCVYAGIVQFWIRFMFRMV